MKRGNIRFVSVAKCASQCSHQLTYGGETMNQRQRLFIDRAMNKLRQVIAACEKHDTAEHALGRRRVGRHVVKVTLMAEREKGFSAPLVSHASSQLPAPPLAKATEHRTRSRGRTQQTF